MSGKQRIRVTVNGQSYEHEVEPRMLLVDYLRDMVGLKGTRFGCDTSNCGSCTVMMEGRSAKSCTFLAVQAHRRHITTVEGLAEPGTLHALQEAFRDGHALQCGFCTSGMLMSAYALLKQDPDPSYEAIRDGISGNLCRCTGYLPIVEAVKLAARKLRNSGDTTHE
jgi:aerobic-type carbon monoxide dehydrogenase small subunit (CoxS/CutS family)